MINMAKKVWLHKPEVQEAAGPEETDTEERNGVKKFTAFPVLHLEILLTYSESSLAAMILLRRCLKLILSTT